MTRAIDKVERDEFEKACEFNGNGDSVTVYRRRLRRLLDALDEAQAGRDAIATAVESLRADLVAEIAAWESGSSDGVDRAIFVGAASAAIRDILHRRFPISLLPSPTTEQADKEPE